MKRIALLGDSHSAALKVGWDRLRNRFTGFELTFFAAPESDWNSLRAMDHCLTTSSDEMREKFRRSSKGAETIDASFDAYVTLGLGLYISVSLKVWTKSGATNQEFVRQYSEAKIGNSYAASILPKLRAITSNHVLVVAAPFQPEQFCPCSAGLKDSDGAFLSGLFREQCERLAAANGAAFVPQPSGTVAPNQITTLSQFANDKDGDLVHCNADYGVRVLKRVFKQL